MNYDALPYAFDQLNGAIDSLASGDEPLAERLRSVYGYHIRYIKEEQITDASLAKKIAGVKRQLQRLNDLTTDDQQQLARQIVSAFVDTIRRLAQN